MYTYITYVLLTCIAFISHIDIAFILHTYIALILNTYISFMLHTYTAFLLHSYIAFILHTYVAFILYSYTAYFYCIYIEFIMHTYMVFIFIVLWEFSQTSTEFWAIVPIKLLIYVNFGSGLFMSTWAIVNVRLKSKVFEDKYNFKNGFRRPKINLTLKLGKQRGKTTGKFLLVSRFFSPIHKLFL